jgi:hypothetical protein
LAPDDKRVAAILASEEATTAKAPTHLTLLLNFFDELRPRTSIGQIAWWWRSSAA